MSEKNHLSAMDPDNVKHANHLDIDFPLVVEDISPKMRTITISSQDSGYRKKLAISVWTAGVFLAMGLAYGHLTVYNTHIENCLVDSEETLDLIGLMTVGYILGCFTCGILYTTMNKDGLMYIGSATLGLSCLVFAASGISSLFLIKVIYLEFAFSFGMVTTCGFTEQARQWGREGPEFLHLLQFTLALGQVASASEVTPAGRQLARFPVQGDTDEFTIKKHLFYFTIYGLGCIVASLPFMVLYEKRLHPTVETREGPDSSNGPHSQWAATHQPVNSTKWSTLMMLLIMIGLYFVFFSIMEKSCREMLLVFVVGKFDTAEELQSRYMTLSGTYASSFVASSCVMIFVSKMVSGTRLVLLSLIFMLVLVCDLYFFLASQSPVAIAVLSGIGMSAMFPAGLNWVQCEFFNLSAPVVSYILIACVVGKSLSPLSLLDLMEKDDHIRLPFMAVFLLVSMFAVFSLLLNSRKNQHGSLAVVTPEKKDKFYNMPLYYMALPENTV